MLLFAPLSLLLALAAAPAHPMPTNYPRELSRWVHTQPPAPGSDAWYAANYDPRIVWKAVRVGGVMEARPVDPDAPSGPKPPFTVQESRRFPGRQSWQRVSDGWLVGFDAGEWEGSLWWFSSDGKRRYRVSNDQVRFFLRTPKALVACEGLAHLGTRRGHVVELVWENGRWQPSRRVDLHDAPEVGLVGPDGSLLLVTSGRLLRVHPDEKVDTLVGEAFWRGLYPCTLTQGTGGDLYVGMRHGLAYLHSARRTYEVQWLVPDRTYLEVKEKP